MNVDAFSLSGFDVYVRWIHLQGRIDVLLFDMELVLFLVMNGSSQPKSERE